jgi:plasmid stability protein
MVQLTIDLPDELAEAVERTAAAQGKSISHYALDLLRAAVAVEGGRRGSPQAVLRALEQAPPIDPETVDQMEAAIREGKLPVSFREP